MGTPARLRPQDRREQLLGVGLDLVADSSFDAVSMEDVAAGAGVSRALVFHYFPSKRELQVAVAERAMAELVAAARPDPTLPPAQQLRAGVTAYLDYVAPRRGAYLSLVRGAGAGDPRLREVSDRARHELADLVLRGVGLDPADIEPLLVLAVRGWLAFVEEMVVHWLADPGTDRDELIEVMVAALLAPAERLLDAETFARLVT